MKVEIGEITYRKGQSRWDWWIEIDGVDGYITSEHEYSSPRSAKRGAARWLARMGNEIQSVDYEGWDCVLHQKWFVGPKSKFITKRKGWQDILAGLEARGMIEVVK